MSESHLDKALEALGGDNVADVDKALQDGGVGSAKILRPIFCLLRKDDDAGADRKMISALVTLRTLSLAEIRKLKDDLIKAADIVDAYRNGQRDACRNGQRDGRHYPAAGPKKAQRAYRLGRKNPMSPEVEGYLKRVFNALLGLNVG